MATVHNALDPEAKERLERLLEAEEQAAAPSTSRDRQVTPDVCALLRYTATEADTKKAVARAFPWVSYDQVLIHVNGECACDDRTHVHYDECMGMRIRAHEGATADALAVLYDLSHDAVWLHLSGRCQHEDGIEPLPTDNGPVAYHDSTT